MTAPKFWLMKAEPDSRVVKGKDVKFSVDDFEAASTTPWEGVRNHEAKNLMKSMHVGDKVLFYHSNCKTPGIAGFAEVSKEAYPDYTAWDPKHPYYDPKTDEANPKWFMVEVKFASRAAHFVPYPYLRDIAAGPSEPPSEVDYIGSNGVKAIKAMALVNRGRLSVQPVEEAAWKVIVEMAAKGGWGDGSGKGRKKGKDKVVNEEQEGGDAEKPKTKTRGRKRKASGAEDDDALSLHFQAPSSRPRPRQSRHTVLRVVMSSADAAAAPPSTPPPASTPDVPPADPQPYTAPEPATSAPLPHVDGPLLLADPPSAGPDDQHLVDVPDVGDHAFVVVDQDEGVDGGHEGVNGHVAGQEGIIVMEGTDEGGQWYQDGDNHELKRVKVYELQNSKWVDQGTAFCFGHYDDTTSEALLVARAESDYNQIILKTTIRSSDVYQRQQETLIVWTEPDGIDYALSFQDPEGCAEVWSFIIEVQRIHASVPEEPQGESSSPRTGSEPSVTTASIIRSGHLPQPALGIIPEIDKAIRALSRTQQIKDKICEYIQRSDYIRAMIDVMNQAEDLENLENLHALCGLMQTILMMNDHGMYEHILEDDRFFGVLGMLEYDPEFPSHKANYREFLRESTHYHQPIDIHDPNVQKKIHHTYRLQFLKDVVLARALDDSTFNVLNSCILFNQIDIITHVQNDTRFLSDIVGLFIKPPISKDAVKMDTDEAEKAKPNGVASAEATDEEHALDRRRADVILLIQQLCIMGKNVQLPARMALFKTLVDRNILHAIQWAIAQPETTEDGQQMIAIGGEVLVTLLDHDVNGVREHVTKQCEQCEVQERKDDSLMTLLCLMTVRSHDMAVQTLMGDSLRMMLEMPTVDSSDPTVPTKLFSRPKDDARIEKFLDFFYKLCIHSLLKPIFEIPEASTLPESGLVLTRERTNLLLSLCDSLSTFALQHSFRAHFFMLSTSISARVAALLTTRDKHLRLAALRFFRAHLRNNNRNFFIHIIKLDIFQSILDLTVKESRRDTLLSSSCLEFFEYLRRENVKELIAHVMTRHEPQVRRLADARLTGECFSGIIRRHDQNIHPQPLAEDEKPVPSQPLELRRLELEEESYFNTDDDDDDDAPPLVSTPPLSRFQFGQKRKRQRMPGLPVRPVRPPAIHLPRTPPIGSLVDYGGEDDDEPGPPPPPPADTPPTPPAGRRLGGPGEYFGAGAGADDEDEDDRALEALVAKPAAAFAPLRPEKRRRDDDDDEMTLERLVTKAKRPSIGGGAGAAKLGDDGPKKIKLKFGAAGMAVAAAAAAPPRSEPGTKDADTG
ncbi:DUF625-domain-containing protein [Auriscalpium vulgare]|uniref:DUF625-domain-containing protein n=1 Tax=Auriscalpium vulgare TaxID=40419 RepID=A0ACB8S1G9_9AGAM|nr:DUF625-domain-containing protein [Auriscalpium vulgare]